MTQVDPAFYAAGIVLPGPTSAANATGQIAVWNDSGFDSWIGTWDLTTLTLPAVLKLAYDASNHVTFTVASNGALTIDPSDTSGVVTLAYPGELIFATAVAAGWGSITLPNTKYYRGTNQAQTLSYGLIGITSANKVDIDPSGLGVLISGLVDISNSSNYFAIGGGATAMDLRLLEPSGSGTNYAGFKAQAMAANVVWTLPAADGTTGQFIKTDGSGVLSFATISGGGDALVANPLSQFAATTSAQLAGVISDETGSGALVFANTPTMVTPVLGVATVTTVNKVTITAPATGSTLTIADGATLTVSASATITNGTHSGTNTGDQTNITGNAGTVTVADAGGDTTTWVLLGTSQTGSLAPATDAGLTYNATTNALTATTFVGALTGNADTVTTNANLTGHVTSTGNSAVLGSFTIAQLNTAVSDANVQPEDATLTAFAALTIAANSLTIGTGADAFSQTTFAANTFPARASTGDLVAKAITDAALTVLDDTTVSAMVDTLGGASATGTGGLVRATSPTFAGRVTHVATAQAWVDDSDGATITFDLTAGNYHRVTLAGNRTLALSNATSGGQAFILKLTQDATGSRTVTWFAGISWAGGSAPTLTTTANKSDTLGFIRTGSNTYDGFVVGQNI